MASYANKIKFLDKTNEDFGTIVGVTFDGGTNQNDTYLSLDPVYVDKFDGTMRYDFGAKYNSVAEFDVTFLKQDKSDFTMAESTAILKWLNRKQINWIELYDSNNELVCMYLGRTTKILQEKMDGRTIGLIMTFTSISPFAYSDVITETYEINSENKDITIENNSDDLDNYLYPVLTIQTQNTVDSMSIENEELSETLIINNLKQGEKITIDNLNKIVYSDNSYRVIGNDLTGMIAGTATSYPVWFRLTSGTNTIHFEYSAETNITCTISYRLPMKVGAY